MPAPDLSQLSEADRQAVLDIIYRVARERNLSPAQAARVALPEITNFLNELARQRTEPAPP